MVTSSVSTGHVPLRFHSNTFAPISKLVAVVVEAKNGTGNTAFPAITSQTPVPFVGVLAINVYGEEQIVSSSPANANDVGTKRSMLTSSQTAGQEPEAGKVQRNTVVPVPKPLTEVLAESGFAIRPLPLMSVQIPPLVGDAMAAS